jgi:hypothetical protein
MFGPGVDRYRFTSACFLLYLAGLLAVALGADASAR